jgi:hypothetical protein
MATTAEPLSLDADNELQQLSEALAVLPRPNEVEPEGLRQVLDDRIEDLKKLLDHPPKNDASRNKLKEGPRCSLRVWERWLKSRQLTISVRNRKTGYRWNGIQP